MVILNLWHLFLQISFISFSSFALSVSYSLQFKRKSTGSPSLCKQSFLARFRCKFCFCDPSALSFLFSVLQFQKFFFSRYFLEEWLLVLISYEMCQGKCLYNLCVLSFPIFQPIYLWRAFCYLVVFQMVIVGCSAVDVLLFLRLLLQVSLLVHFLENLDGLGSILI